MGVMSQFTGVFFHVDARDANAIYAAVDLDIDKPVLGKRQLILGNLISLRQVGIKIVFACKTAFTGYPHT